MVLDPITGKQRVPAAPTSGVGVTDIQVAEAQDLRFGDSEKLEFGDAADVTMQWDATDLAIAVAAGSVVLTSTHGAITGEEHSLDIVSTATLSSGDGLVGLNVAVTPSGTAGAWVSAVFGKVTEVAAAPGPVGGYFCGAEFEVNITGSQPSAYAVLVLNSNADNSTYGQTESYVWLREYGDKAVRSLLGFMDHSRESESNAVIVSQTGSKPFDTAIRCTIGSAGTTGLWLLASSVGPADADIDFKMLGSAAANYFEYDASGDVLNVVAADVAISGEHHALSVTHTGTLSSGEGIVGVNAVVTPKGTAGQWASAFFGKVELTDANDPIPGTGYASGAEFEVTLGSGVTPCDTDILVLNDGISCAHYAESAYIRCRKYGSTYPINLFKFDEESVASAHDSGRMIVETSAIPAVDDGNWILFRVRVGTTTVWLAGTTTAPAA